MAGCGRGQPRPAAIGHDRLRPATAGRFERRPLRTANVDKMRAMIEGATADGNRVIVVTSLIGARTIQKKLRKDLDGLEYDFNAKGLVQHDLFLEWIGETIRTEMARAATTATN